MSVGDKERERDTIIGSNAGSKAYTTDNFDTCTHTHRICYFKSNLIYSHLSGRRDLSACLIVLFPGRRVKKSASMSDITFVSSIAGRVVVTRVSSKCLSEGR